MTLASSGEARRLRTPALPTAALGTLMLGTLMLGALGVGVPLAAQDPPLPEVAADGPSVAEAMAAVEGAQPGADPGSLGALTIEQLLDTLRVPGLSLAVIHDFEIHWAKGYGVRDVETGAPVDTETIFQAASISKPVAAMASLHAAQNGLFDLDQDINTILTSWQLDGEGFTERRAVTPRMLMSHTSGLGDAFGYPGYDPGTALPTAVQTLDGHPMSNTRELFMEREPMTAFEYSGGGVTLQQVALSDARGVPFAELMWSDVLAPLGMRHSFFSQPMPPPRESNAASAHDGAGERKGEARWHVYPEQAAAGLWTTASDLARFLIEVQLSVRGESNRVLNRAYAREMITPVGVGRYAVGFGLQQIGTGWYFGHGGSNWGYRADVVAHVANGYGLAQMTNGDRGGPLMAEIRDRVARAYGWDMNADAPPRGYRPIEERATIELPIGQLEPLVGRYERRGDLPIIVELEGSVLRMTPQGEGTYTLRAVSPSTFLLEGANAERVLQGAELMFQGDAGGALGLILKRGGTQRRWERVQR